MNKLIKKSVSNELKRQRNNIELIASENFVSKDILKLQGSVLTNKYAEGYSGKRYYGGCKYIDEVETHAIKYACELFDCKYANVQPHSGSSANMAVYKALLNIGDKVMGMNLSHGGHLTHGHPINFSGLDYNIVSYDVDLKTEMLDYDAIEALALKEKPKMIIAGASAYSRFIDFKRFRSIADKCGAYLMVDMAHIAGLVATGEHPSPLPYAHVVTSTTHKTLRGPRGGIIVSNDLEIGKAIDKSVFPRCQGGPLENTILAKAVCFKEDLQPEFKEYAKQVVKNAKALAQSLQNEGVEIITGGTDNHLLLINVKKRFNVTGLEAQKLLEECNITANKNSIPNDTEKPAYTSGLRLGTPAMTTRGYKEADFDLVGKLIAEVLKNPTDENIKTSVKEKVHQLNSKYPLPYEN